MAEPFNVDSIPENADWTKMTLDVFDEKGKRVTDVEELARRLGMTVAKVKSLPVYLLAKDQFDG